MEFFVVRGLRSLALVVVSGLCCSVASAYTMTFEDEVSGHYPSYYVEHYGTYFNSGFAVADHFNSTWGHPHSGNNVLVNVGYSSWGMLKFRIPNSFEESYSVYSLTAYFSTAYDKQIRIDAWHASHGSDNGYIVDSVLVGGVGEAWENAYVTLGSSAGDIDFFMFYGVNSPSDLVGFCADDMTIVPVPEPSSLVVLGIAMMGRGVVFARKRGLGPRTREAGLFTPRFER